MAQDKTVRSGSTSESKGGSSELNGPVIAIVKNNVDPTHSGRIQVFVANGGSEDPDDSNSWITVGYLSPFYGISTPDNGLQNSDNVDGYGKFIGNPQSYGFWATAPAPGTEVVCIFIDGNMQQGYYIGCVPKAGLLQMTPGLGSSNVVVPNEGEAETYGGADRLPVGEVNYSNPSIKNSAVINNDPKPVQSYQASILLQQGLVRDNLRGVISSSAQRETPSRVFGISTPGRTIYEGGYNNSNIIEASQSADEVKLKKVGSTGGHTFVMDDGTIDGKDQLMRFRTADGHQIIMSDSGQTLFIIHSNGQSWIELGKEGTIDMFATNSVNIRTQGDLNLHADRDVNINAERNLNLFAKDVSVESDNNMTLRSGAQTKIYSLGPYTIKSDSAYAVSATGVASMSSSGPTYINGGIINLNTGSSPVVPQKVTALPKTNHLDTAFSTGKGWMYPSPDALVSVVSRAPTHQPWAESGKGVDVTISSAVNTSKAVTSPVTDAVNSATPSVPKNPITPAISNSLPTQKPLANGLNSSVSTNLAAQQAVNNSLLKSGDPIKQAINSTTNTQSSSQLQFQTSKPSRSTSS